MITASFDDRGLGIRLNDAPSVTRRQLQRWMTLFMARLESAVKKNIGNGGLIGRRTGNLARSIRSVVITNGDQIVGEIGPDALKAIYGAIQEHGGTIFPKRSRHLAIPLRGMTTGAGVARGSARQVIQSPSAFGFKRTFFRKGIIFGVKDQGSIVPLFVLKTQVTIPARHYLAKSLEQETAWGLDLLAQITQETTEIIFGGAK